MAWIGALIGAAVSMYGQNQSNKTAKAGLKDQKKLITEQIDISRLLRPYSEKMLQQGQQSMAMPLRYYTALASGNRSAGMGALAGDISQYNAGQDEALRKAAEITPRGCGRSLLLAGDASKRADAISRLYMGQRAQAVDKLGALADNQTRLGMGGISSLLGGLQGATSGYQGMFSNMMQQRALSNQESEAAGAALMDAWNGYRKWYADRKAGATTDRQTGTWV